MPILLPELDHFVQQEANANRFSGVVLLAHDSRPIYEAAHGFADLACVVDLARPGEVPYRFR